jgi:tetratricopeptide (TPR) repeat protein
MTSHQIARFLESPHLINELDLPVLEKSIETYPYVGLFHMLYLKGLHNTQSIYFDKALKTAALVINDRAKLHEILYAPVANEEKEPVVEEKAVVVKEEIIIEADIDQEEAAIEIVPEIEIEIEELKPEVDLEMQQLQDNIVTEAIDHSLQVDINTLLGDFETEDTKQSEVTPIEIEEEKESLSHPKSFGDWLNVMLPSDQETEKTTKTEAPLKSSKDLINQFIATANKRIKVADNTPKSIESAHKSIEDKNDFATETLAQVYASQKKYSKAIEIYELLALKFPEKKTFFASRIRFLKEKIEYDK